MEEPFKPLSLSIGELFGNKDALYKIPQYQRPYKWEDEQVDKLWDDICDAFENNEDNYFLGSVITAKPRDNEKSAYVDVVDGQQRLTTLMILFCVIRDLFPEINQDNSSDNPFAVDIDTIEASITHLGKADRLKLYTHSQHQSDFHDFIISGNTAAHKKPYKYQINNIPFPLGYLHNQRDALVDHPTFGKPWVRLFYMLQWIVLTIFFIFCIKKKIFRN
jgi:uncharacterized protein with ParB-like and HNH nuclease domain